VRHRDEFGNMNAQRQSVSSALRGTRRAMFSSRDQGRLPALIDTLHPSEIASLLSALPIAERYRAWYQIERALRGRVLAELGPDVRRTLIRSAVDSAGLDSVVESARDMDMDDLADLAAELPEAVVRHVLASLGRADRERLRRALSYPPDSAGGLMNPEVISVRPDVTVEVVLRYLRMRRPLPSNLDGVFVVDRRERLLGAIPLERLATAQLDTFAGALMDVRTSAVSPKTSAREVAQLFADRDLTSLAVVGTRGRLLGRITADDVVDVIREAGEVSVRRLGQLPARAHFFTSVLRSATQRSPWLAFGLLGAGVTAFIVMQFVETLRTVGEVAAFMPVVASLAGVFGLQTATLTVRGLALGHIGPHNRARLLAREVLIALLLWSVLAGALWVATAGWSDSAHTSVAAAFALGLTFVVAAAFGILAPQLLQRIGIDPLFSTSGVTAVTDVIAYGSILVLVTWLPAR
jgi:magnesium transporter